MPRYTSRQAGVRKLLSVYSQWKRASVVRKQQHRHALKTLQRTMSSIPRQARHHSILSPTSTASSSDDSLRRSDTWASTACSTEDSDSGMDSISESFDSENGLDSINDDSSSSSSGTDSDNYETDSSLDSDDLTDDISESWDSSNLSDLGDSGDEADNEDEDEDEVISEDDGPTISQRIHKTLVDAFATRYQVPRNMLPRGPAYMHHVLKVLKLQRPDHFRTQLRVSPTTFDRLVDVLQRDSVFINNSNNPQMPVCEQLAIALYRFGRNGNGVTLQDVANWAGVAKGTVLLATQRVMTAVLRPNFMQAAVRYPTPVEKKEAKRWVQNHSCRAWRHGWLFVDGTLIPLYSRPYWYGESYYDRKSHYSLNVQVSQFIFLC